jgi:hypothetical protein
MVSIVLNNFYVLLYKAADEQDLCGSVILHKLLPNCGGHLLLPLVASVEANYRKR